MISDFQHKQAAHCESGAVANLLSYYRVPMSEALTFGIGEGLFFGYIPFVRLNNLPLITFRSIAGSIIKKVTKNLQIDVCFNKYRDPHKAMDELDRFLDNGIPIGLQTGAFWLPYFPRAYRFHFNMHNLVVLGKKGQDYIISDPVFPDLVSCDGSALMKARFAKGAMSPKGKMYYFNKVPSDLDPTPFIVKGLKNVTNTMLKNPIPILGVKGIRFMAGRLEKWSEKFEEHKLHHHLGQIVRMQEEIGTGGAGFRFIFAAFLQEASSLCHDDDLQEFSERMTQIGDHWRHFAVLATRICKGRAKAGEGVPVMAAKLRKCAALEEELYRDIQSITTAS